MAYLEAIAALTAHLPDLAHRAGQREDQVYASLSAILPETVLQHINSMPVQKALSLVGNENTAPHGQMQSLFNFLGRGSTQPHYVPLLPLDHIQLKENFFPQPEGISQAEQQQAYTKLWHSILDAIEPAFRFPDEATVVQQILDAFQRYTWCVPGPANDVSLYDQARITAAVAAATSTKTPEDSQSVATFVGGDISGIQRFIYTVTAKGAAKALRARSFYLQLLTEAVARWLLRKFGMPITNLVYVGGGRFYLLLPPDVDSELMEFRRILDEVMLKHHDGDLYLALGSSSLQEDDFVSQKFAEKWADVGHGISKDKQRRFAHLPSKQLHSVFEPRPSAYSDELSLRRIERDEMLDKAEEDADIHSSLGTSLNELGTYLPNAEYLLVIETEPEQSLPAGSFDNTLAALGYSAHLFDKYLSPYPDTVPTHSDRATLFGLHKVPDKRTHLTVQERLGCPVASGLRFLVNVIADKNYGKRAEFGDLQAASQGLKRLGVLRMDVDDLGNLFAHGFRTPDGTSKASLVRVAGLSFSLGLFFEGWVDHICSEFNKKYRTTIAHDGDPDHHDSVEAIYSVYSGGDDLFLVGRWDVMPELADTIRSDFAKYTANNPDVHISAGLTLHGGKYPLYQAAEDSERALGTAKGLPGKNAINLFGETISWSEWDQLLDWQATLGDLAQDKKVGRALLHTVIRFYRDYRDQREKDLQAGARTRTQQSQIVWGPWLWRSAYQLSRLSERAPHRKSEIAAIHPRMKENDFRGIELAGIGARWADALTRTDRSDDSA